MTVTAIQTIIVFLNDNDHASLFFTAEKFELQLIRGLNVARNILWESSWEEAHAHSTYISKLIQQYLWMGYNPLIPPLRY